jgi:hypothetical protein
MMIGSIQARFSTLQDRHPTDVPRHGRQRPLPAHGLEPAQQKLPEPHPRNRLYGLLALPIRRAPGAGLDPMPHALGGIGRLTERRWFTEAFLPRQVMGLTPGGDQGWPDALWRRNSCDRWVVLLQVQRNGEPDRRASPDHPTVPSFPAILGRCRCDAFDRCPPCASGEGDGAPPGRHQIPYQRAERGARRP